MPSRFKLTLEYDGTDFVGWGVQPGQRSIQGEIEAAIEKLTGTFTRVDVSGRTDAGVHALGQVCAFSTPASRSEKEVRDGLNRFLPLDVAVIEAERVSEDFDPRRGAKQKQYRYRWVSRSARSPLQRHRAWHVRADLDAEAMDRAVQYLAGTHDFQTFRASSCCAPSTVRTSPHWAVTRRGEHVTLESFGHGYLQHMIRIVAGSLYEIGRAKRSEEWLAECLSAKDRTVAGPTAPACGLTLVSVQYPSSD